jgi:hypothetical protein
MSRVKVPVVDGTTLRIPPAQVGGLNSWQPSTFYAAGETVVDGTHVVRSLLDHTSGASTRDPANWTELGAAAAIRTSTTVAYAATITPALPSSGDLILNIGALTAPVTIANPTGTPVDGQKIQFRFSQDGTGGRGYSFGDAYSFGSDVVLGDLPTTANARFELVASWCAPRSQWRLVGIARGF